MYECPNCDDVAMASIGTRAGSRTRVCPCCGYSETR